jgi:hypothetical protein
MRRGGTPTPITHRSADVWTLQSPDPDDFPLARALSESDSLDAAEVQAARGILRPGDIDLWPLVELARMPTVS